MTAIPTPIASALGHRFTIRCHGLVASCTREEGQSEGQEGEESVGAREEEKDGQASLEEMVIACRLRRADRRVLCQTAPRAARRPRDLAQDGRGGGPRGDV